MKYYSSKLFNIISAGSTTSSEPSVQAFLTATGITDSTIITALDTLVIDLKYNDIWNKMKAIYPMVGSTYATHKFNLKNPLDSDAAFRLSNGAGTHSSNGFLTTGASSTFINPSVHLTNNSTHISYYSRNAVGGTLDLGCYTNSFGDPRMLLVLSFGNTFESNQNEYNAAPTTRVAQTVTDAWTVGYFIATRQSNVLHKAFKNGTQISTTNTNVNVTALPTSIMQLNNYGSGRQCAFATVGDGLSDAEVEYLNSAVQAFQTTLGRQV